MRTNKLKLNPDTMEDLLAGSRPVLGSGCTPILEGEVRSLTRFLFVALVFFCIWVCFLIFRW